MTETQRENSDVFPFESVAVAVIWRPNAVSPVSAVSMAAIPVEFVVILLDPRNISPAPLPVELHEALEKNSTTNVCEGRLLRVPVMVVAPPLDEAVVRNG